MLRTTYLSFIAIILFGLTACGFHLRDQNSLPPRLHTLYLQTDTPYGTLESTLRQALHSSGVTLVDNKRLAPITLQISPPIRGDYNATVGSSSQSRVYALTYSVTFTLFNNQGKMLLPPQLLTSNRSLTLAANQLLQSNNQLSTLNRQMERDIISQLYYYLRSEKVAQALQ